MKIFNNKTHKILRQTLRHNMPNPEILLWQKLKGKQLLRNKFRRQYGIGNLVIDFYCPSARLAIEVDGESHFSDVAKRKDKIRDEFIKSLKIRLLRFTNREVTDNIEGVLEKIAGELLTTPSPSLKRRGDVGL
jgi:very-short-patch-repair endonuclease